MGDILLLNLDGQPLTLWPLSTISWQQGIKAHFLGCCFKALIVTAAYRHIGPHDLLLALSRIYHACPRHYLEVGAEIIIRFA